MSPMIKPPNDWSDKSGDENRYDGPPPTPGPYRGVVDKIWRTQVKSGVHKGTDMLLVAVKIADGKFKGASILTNLLQIEQNAWSTNQFLMAMTDGSEKQRTGIKRIYWRTGYQVAEQDEKLGTPITKIGKNFDPIGKPINFVVKNEPDNKGGTRAAIDRFVIPIEDDGEDDATDNDPTPDTSSAEPEETTPSGMDEFAAQDDSDSADGPPPEDGDDADDPWS